MNAAELIQVPANANPADYNRVERFVLTSVWTDGSTSRTDLTASTVVAAQVEAGKARAALSTLPIFVSCKLTREVRYVYEPYCSEKHGTARAWM